MLVDQIIESAFYRGRTPRSDQYKAGMRAILEFWAGFRPGAPVYPPCPYLLGTAEADAWFAGAAEGRSLSVSWGLTERQAPAA